MKQKKLYAAVILSFLSVCAAVSCAVPGEPENKNPASTTLSSSADTAETGDVDSTAEETTADNRPTASEGLTYVLQRDGTYAVGAGSNQLENEVVIPDTYKGAPVTAIHSAGFAYHGEITKITLPDSIVYIGIKAFQQCANLTQIQMPDSVTAIGHSAFYGCQNLTDIRIPDGVTAIGDSTFFACHLLSDVSMSQNVTTIGESAFAGCYALPSIELPQALELLGNQAFQACKSLKKIKRSDCDFFLPRRM